jgi:hypothetical protein
MLSRERRCLFTNTRSLPQDFRANQSMKRIGLGRINRAAKQLFQLLTDAHQCQQ